MFLTRFCKLATVLESFPADPRNQKSGGKIKKGKKEKKKGKSEGKYLFDASLLGFIDFIVVGRAYFSLCPLFWFCLWPVYIYLFVIGLHPPHFLRCLI